MKRLILLGGGHAHVEVLRRFGERPLSAVEIVLVSPSRYTAYSGMLPGLVAGHYSFESCHIDLEPLARRAAARRIEASVVGLDAADHAVATDDGGVITCDVLSIDVGGVPALHGIAGAAEHAIGVRPVDRLLSAWAQLIDRARRAPPARIVVVGGGAAGIELLLAMQVRLRQALGAAMPAFQLVTDTAELLPGHASKVRRIFARVLAERGVTVHLGSAVTGVDRGGIVIADGASIPADAVVLATGVAAPGWFGGAGFALDARGFIALAPTLRSISHEAIFAAGDCATMIEHPRPKSGVHAVRQGAPLAANLRAALTGGRLRSFVPQRAALALISTGNRHAVASRGAFAVEGEWVWRWKDWIDRRFMRRYRAS